MTRFAPLIPPYVPHACCGGICPHCNGSAYRVQRRSLDFLINFFMPIYRYRCGSMGCSWEGNLRIKPFPPLIPGPL